MRCSQGPRPRDGRKIHPMYLLQVKSPEESKATDYFKIGRASGGAGVPALNEGNCPMVAGK